MNSSWVIALPAGVTALTDEQGRVLVAGWDAGLALRNPTSAMLAAVEHLSYPGATLPELTRHFQHRSPGELSRFLRFVRRLAGLGLACFTCLGDDGALATLEPTAPSLDLSESFSPESSYRLSRFAYLHRIGDLLVLETPLGPARVTIEDSRVLIVLAELRTPSTIDKLCDRTGFLSTESATSLISLLAIARMITHVTPDGLPVEDDNASLRQWEFHDLLFHARSRLGRHGDENGAMYHWAGVADPPPPVRPNYPGEAVSLFRPDLERLAEGDPTLTAVCESRRSVREYGRRPITAEQLGELLYRTARVTSQYDADIELMDGSVRMGFAPRPYPCAGALYELEIYPVIQQCGGIAPGIYHHDPLNHALTPVSADRRSLDELISCAASRAYVPCEKVQVLLVFAARFSRINWKYSGIAYSVILKDVGVLMQSIYLAATAMKLAPCALGLGNSDLFANAIGSDYYAETSVGEFLLGSLPEHESS
ncbi:MAG: SagB family peptide dehydrogenase [Planctomycetales bacterium]|nr:SagB family peptide dehydrogenase [Planctomycetales bacterium]